MFIVTYLVAKRRPKDDHVLLTQLVAPGATGRLLREWRRTSDKGNPDSYIYDGLADLIKNCWVH
jgi:hypothetical protein